VKTPKLFRAIWRINSVLILAVAALAFCVLAYAGYQIFKDRFDRRQVGDVVNVEPEARVRSEWTLGSFEQVDGTGYFMAPARSKQSYQQSYYEKDASAVRNYLFVNAADKSSRWLVPQNGYLFLGVERLLRPGDEKDDNAVRWMKYEVVKSDTNGDGRMTDKDGRTIAVSGATGEGYAELIPDVSEVLGSKLTDENTLLVFYNISGSGFVSEINLPERRVAVTKELPMVVPQ
jgi:hypothetical protein